MSLALEATVASPPRRVRARRALATVFFVNGAVLASWVPHIPAVKDRHGLGDGPLGLVLLAMSAGAVFALPAAGRLVGRLGSRRMTARAALAFCLLLPLPLASASVPLLVVSLILLGAANGLLDVSMNAHAVAVEGHYGRPIMASFHALFSLGGVAGALVAGGAMRFGVPDLGHVTVAAAMGALAVAVQLPALGPGAAAGSRPGPVFGRPPRALLALGGLAFLGLLAEGAMGDWSAVYLRDAVGATPATAAAGFAAFSLAMAAGRASGDRLVARLGPARVLRGSGAAAAVGLAVALVLGDTVAAIVGCALVGLGVANVIPILFSAAGRVHGVPAGRALAAVTTLGYLGFLAGPPLIGLVAELAGLPLALGLVSLACGSIAAGVRHLPADRAL